MVRVQEKYEDTMLLVLMVEEWACQEPRIEHVSRKGEEPDSPLESLERINPHYYLNFSPVKLILTSRSLSKLIYVVLSN